MNTATHTPTPWNDVHVARSGNGQPFSAECQLVNPRNAAAMRINHDGSPEGWANVAFMAMACSKHYELVAALQAIRSEAKHKLRIGSAKTIIRLAESALTKVGAA